jgi:hypothetical protein
VKATESVSTIIGHQYASISRGKDSIFGMIQAAGYNPSDYIAFYNLRQYDRSEPCLLRSSSEAASADTVRFAQSNSTRKSGSRPRSAAD